MSTYFVFYTKRGMNVVVKSKDTDETRSMCFELPADPRRL